MNKPIVPVKSVDLPSFITPHHSPPIPISYHLITLCFTFGVVQHYRRRCLLRVLELSPADALRLRCSSFSSASLCVFWFSFFRSVPQPDPHRPLALHAPRSNSAIATDQCSGGVRLAKFHKRIGAKLGDGQGQAQDGHDNAATGYRVDGPFAVRDGGRHRNQG